MRWLQQDTIYLRGTTEKIKTYRVVQCTLVKGGDQREPGEPEPGNPEKAERDFDRSGANLGSERGSRCE